MSHRVHHHRGSSSNKDAIAERIGRRRTEAEIVAHAVENAIKRDPCFRCGIRFDQHDDHGCKRWVGGTVNG